MAIYSIKLAIFYWCIVLSTWRLQEEVGKLADSV